MAPPLHFFDSVCFLFLPLHIHGDARTDERALPHRKRVECMRKDVKLLQAVMVDESQPITAQYQFFTVLT